MVIQRWQSVFLLIAALLMAFYAFLPVAGFTFGGVSYELSLLGISSLVLDGGSAITPATVSPEVVSWPLSVLVAVLSLVAIFKFKQMKLQKTLCMACIILTVAVIASLLVLVNGWSDLRYYFSNVMPVLAILFYILAIRGITKDQKILSSYDRLR